MVSTNQIGDEERGVALHGSSARELLPQDLVLVAHEDVTEAGEIHRAFADVGSPVVEVHSVVEALAHPQLHRAAVVIASAGLRGGGGFDLARRLHVRQSRAHVHLLVRPEAAASARAAVEVGQVASYSTVPVAPSELPARIRRAVEQTDGLRSRSDPGHGDSATAMAYDPLTGLPNRAIVEERMSAALAGLDEKSGPDGPVMAVLFIDLDGFKTVNDYLGHHVGDAILRTIGRRITANRRQGDTVGRYGGDEFVVVCPRISPGAVEELAERILAAVRAVVEVDGIEHRLSASIGITTTSGVAPSGGLPTPSDLIRQADLAMYEAKALGRDRWVRFEPSLEARANARAEMRQALRDALGRDELVLVYQPVISLDNGRAVGAEALLRWRRPLQGMVEPAAFLSVAEEAGLTVAIGEWVLGRALSDLMRWRSEHDVGPGFRVWVNVWPHQLTHVRFVDALISMLEATGAAPSVLGLDLAASAVPFLLSTSNAVAELRQMGVELNLDDFGGVHTTLTGLDQVQFSGIKLAPELVRTLDRPAERFGAGMVRALIGLGRELQVTLLGEGVETRSQADALRAMGCHLAQGYHFARPDSIERIDVA